MRPLRDLNHAIDGEPTSEEELRLELQRRLAASPDLAARLVALPGRVFSGKAHPTPGARGVFFCYRLPRPDYLQGGETDKLPWSEAAGETRWYLYLLDQDRILEEPAEIIAAIRCEPDTPRRCLLEQATLAEIRDKVARHIKNTFLKRMQAPVGVHPILTCWMELN